MKMMRSENGGIIAVQEPTKNGDWGGETAIWKVEGDSASLYFVIDGDAEFDENFLDFLNQADKITVNNRTREIEGSLGIFTSD